MKPATQLNQMLKRGLLVFICTSTLSDVSHFKRFIFYEESLHQLPTLYYDTPSTAYFIWLIMMTERQESCPPPPQIRFFFQGTSMALKW
jgi:hypothetical protein